MFVTYTFPLMSNVSCCCTSAPASAAVALTRPIAPLSPETSNSASSICRISVPLRAARGSSSGMRVSSDFFERLSLPSASSAPAAAAEDDDDDEDEDEDEDDANEEGGVEENEADFLRAPAAVLEADELEEAEGNAIPPTALDDLPLTIDAAAAAFALGLIGDGDAFVLEAPLWRRDFGASSSS